LNITARALLTLAACAAGLTLAAPAARAETVHPATSAAGEQTCTAPVLFNPLTAFKDKRDYFVAPGGDFEDPALPGWTLSGGATVEAGNESFFVVDPTDAFSLVLPPGSSATSPELCVDLNYPTFRFFATLLADANTDTDLLVDVIYPALAENNVRQARSIRLKARDDWKLSGDVELEPKRLGKEAGWRKIALRFRVEPGKKTPASYRIDDILIDPRRFN
jgi:hypothetical protein